MYISHLTWHNFSLVALLIVTLSDPDLHVINTHRLAYGIKQNKNKNHSGWVWVLLFSIHMWNHKVPSWNSGEAHEDGDSFVFSD